MYVFCGQRSDSGGFKFNIPLIDKWSLSHPQAPGGLCDCPGVETMLSDV